MKRVILTSILVALCFSFTKIETRAQSEDTYICEEYQEYIYEICEEYYVCPEMIMAMIESESSGIAEVTNGNCIGLMQVNPKFHQDIIDELGITDLFDPYQNILAGVNVLLKYKDDYEDIAIVLGHYHGESNVEERSLRGEFSYYVNRILNRSMELEGIHGKYDYETDSVQ